MRLATVTVAVTVTVTGCAGNSDRDPSVGDGQREGSGVHWTRSKVGNDGRTLRFGYTGDVCTDVRSAAVREDDRDVTVTLLDSDPRPDAPRDGVDACVALAEPGCVRVRLAESLGSRRLVDGTPARFPGEDRGADRIPFDRYGPCRSVSLER